MSTCSKGMHNIINERLAHRLVTKQFPQWARLPVRPVTLGGWDNRTFHLGDDMLLRFPSAEEYAVQVEKEQFWLPKLQSSLPLPIPEPIGLGKPAYNYPWKWSIYRWLEGDTAASVQISDKRQLATTLGQFLRALQKIDLKGGTTPGPHNFYRGGPLSTYDAETRRALSILRHKIDTKSATKVWDAGVATEWQHPPVWVHGDMSPGNLLVKRNQLSAVIDFGMLAVGDPACDLTIAWTLFEPEFRNTFRDVFSFDDDTWARGRAWALWKALIVMANMTETNPVESAQSRRVVTEIMEDYRRNR